MKEINRIIRSLLLGCIMFSIFSCKTASIVNFESESFENFKKQSYSLDNYQTTFYFARVTTAVWVNLIFFRFSKENNFSDIYIKNVSIYDDKNTKLFEKDIIKITSNGYVHNEKDVNYEIYSYKIENSELSPQWLSNYETEYIILYFEINGIKYSEKLKRVEKKYIVTQT